MKETVELDHAEVFKAVVEAAARKAGLVGELHGHVAFHVAAGGEVGEKPKVRAEVTFTIVKVDLANTH